MSIQQKPIKKKASRAMCAGCQRPQSVCLCEHFVSLRAPCRVLILQHSNEQKQALATVPLLQACLSPLTVLVGEDFSSCEEVARLLKNKNTCRVVYPSPGAQEWNVTTGQIKKPQTKESIDTLIILDGTWRKAKKIWLTNHWLHDLPCISLVGAGQSQYKIRSSNIEGGVSTIEAVVLALNYMTVNGAFDPLLSPFNAMIDLQIKKMGQEVFEAHYQKTQ